MADSYMMLQQSSHAAHSFVLGSFVAAGTFRVARLPLPGESLLASAFAWEPGGKGFNLAAGLSRLGIAVDGLIPIGTDHLAALAEPALLRAGLSPSMIRQFPGSTGIGVGFVGADGENCLAVHPGANLMLSPDAVRAAEASIAASSLVLAQCEIGDSAIAEAFAIARKAGIPTLLTLSPFRMPPPDVLAATTILVANETEAASLHDGLFPGREPRGSPAEVVSLAGALRTRGVEILVVTSGAAGARIVANGSELVARPGYAVEAVDTIGAGDAFTAGLAAGLLAGQPWDACCRMACACGAMMVMGRGVLDNLPDPAEVAEFLRTRPDDAEGMTGPRPAPSPARTRPDPWP
ncbi:PfkB family carbohydrate kinase [Methylobacterium marchantiae]|uniref:PfkB family carbohydrate kinase n=1 Tax=Methylobacterium marchantiae TaxID=600331 RepID=A0ABW3WVT3_9HYPH